MIDIRSLISKMNCRNPAREQQIAAFEKALGKQLPEDYRQYLEIANGGEGFIGDNAYVILWGVDELVSTNREIDADRWAPGFLAFGSDGGGEAYGFDTRSFAWPTVRLPFLGMAWEEARPTGASFSEFLQHLYEMRGQ